MKSNKITKALLLGIGASIAQVEGAIIYSGLQNIVINVDQRKSINIDMTGANEFQFQVTYTSVVSDYSITVIDRANARGMVRMGGSNDNFANLPSMFPINPAMLPGGYTFGSNAGNRTVTSFGAFVDAQNFTDGVPGFIGFRFNPSGGDLNGWMRVQFNFRTSVTIIDWAYEDSGAGIQAGAAPEPTTGLTLLALGAAGVIARRRRKKRLQAICHPI